VHHCPHCTLLSDTLAKDYAGAAVLVPYFLLALAAMDLLAL